MTERPAHIPVMLSEVLDVLKPMPGEVYVDGTVGAGGHAAAVAERLAPGGCVVGVDRDPLALSMAGQRLCAIPGVSVHLVQSDYRSLGSVLEHLEIQQPDLLLLDLGVSSMQLETPERGFSLMPERDGPLDMRFDPASDGLSAADVVNTWDEERLAHCIRTYGEDPASRRIARAIVNARPLCSTRELAAVVERALGRRRPGTTHPATRTFQALRVTVTGELDGLTEALESIGLLLAPAGRMAVLSYHSLEARAVKKAFERLCGRCQCPAGLPACLCGAVKRATRITRHAVKPSADEISANPRARSAQLRAICRL